MINALTNLFLHFKFSQNTSEYLTVLVVVLSLIILSVIANYILKHYIVRFVRMLVRNSKSKFGLALNEQKAFRRLSHLGPGLILYLGAPLISTSSLSFPVIVHIIQTLAKIYLLLALILFLMSLLDSFLQYYSGLVVSKKRPIQSYIQLLKIALWALTVILLVSIIVNRSPWIFLTGIGAISAVLILVFKDTIMGLVASIQVSAYDMVRVGDWIVIPSMGVNGDVIEVNINTVKVQNFDKTIITVPTYSLISSGVQNWRGMVESGGRRIKRAINIDMNTIRFCDEELMKELHKIELLKTYLSNKEKEIKEYNASHKIDRSVMNNGRALTNIGVFRTYIEAYLRQRSDIHFDLTFLIRQLDPMPTGIPIQLYVFTNDTNWNNYEGIQSDIFDHLLASLPIFKLRAFQNISGNFGN